MLECSTKRAMLNAVQSHSVSLMNDFSCLCILSCERSTWCMHLADYTPKQIIQTVSSRPVYPSYSRKRLLARQHVTPEMESFTQLTSSWNNRKPRPNLQSPVQMHLKQILRRNRKQNWFALLFNTLCELTCLFSQLTSPKYWRSSHVHWAGFPCSKEIHIPRLFI